MNDDENSLDKLQRQLHSRKGVAEREFKKERRERDVSEHKSDWEYEKRPTITESIKKEKPAPAGKGGKHLTLFVTISLVVFVLTTVFVVYRLFFAGALISPRNVSIDIDAPSTTRAGDSVNFDITIENANKVDLLDAKLLVTLPVDTLSADGDGNRIDTLELDLGTIPTDGMKTEEIDVLLFGKEGDDVEIEFFLDYGTPDSGARLSNTVTHPIRISSAPVSVLVAPSLREVQSGNQFEIEIDVRSNTTASLQNLVLEVEYPGGFSFVSSNPSPIEGENIWRIGSLSSQETETVTLRGYLEGVNNESRFFKVRVGEGSGEGQAIGRLFASGEEKVTITAPPISLATDINKSSAHTISSIAGEQVAVRIDWRNTLRDSLRNLVIEAEIDDRYVEAGSVRATGGFYQSSTNTITWDRTTSSSLSLVDPLESGSVSFSFRIADGNTLSGATNPEIPISITVEASEPQDSGSAREIVNRLERVVRIASDLVISQTLHHSSGPNPPQADTPTTYTVRWVARNSGNDVRSASVRAALPTYVSFVEGDQGIQFSQLTNEVVWNIGEIEEGGGFSSSLEKTFVVMFNPSASQVNQAPTLVHDALIEGRDAFTGSVVRSRSSALQSLKVVR